MVAWDRAMRFEAVDGRILCGEPLDADSDIGLASFAGQKIEVHVLSGASLLNLDTARTGEVAVVKRILSPLSQAEVGTIRCIGLNYRKHAKEINMPEPTQPILFLKPATCLGDPWPATTVIAPCCQDEQSDYESELSIILSKSCKDVSEADALDYVLGYACSNDVSARKHQFTDSQWGFSKGFDGSAPLGPVIVSPSRIPDIGQVTMKGIFDGQVVQESRLDDMIFSPAQIISFLSKGTTLPAGTMIMTGTPHGIGWFAKPERKVLKEGTDFRVEMDHGLGTLISVFTHGK